MRLRVDSDFIDMAELKPTIEALADALQTVNLLATQLRRELSESSEVAVELETASNRAVRLIRSLQPKGGNE